MLVVVVNVRKRGKISTMTGESAARGGGKTLEEEMPPNHFVGESGLAGSKS